MAFLQSGVDALLGRVLRRLGLDDPSDLTLEAVRELDRRDLVDVGHHLGLEFDEDAECEDMADPIWRALQAGEAAWEPKPEQTIPWSYGLDRVRGIPVDPNRLYVYWEVTDEAIAEARRGLGPGGKNAWLNLRVYDTSGRLFDGTNAHGSVDHEVRREDRQWFFDIGKPGSEAFVELGMKSHEGYFVPISRSGRIEFPRFAVAPPVARDWMTVRVRPEGLEAAPAAPTRTPASNGGPALRPATFAPPPPAHAQPASAEPAETPEPVREVVEKERTVAHTESWQSGPFSFPVDTPGQVTEHFVGSRQVYRDGERVHVVYGPWEVTIRDIDAHSEKTVLSRWETYRSWVTEEGHAEWAEVAGPAGSSEKRWLGASELRLGGASEAWHLGASELHLRGASEYAYLAASERMLRGASERILGGASEQRLGGASEQLGGASERRFPPLPPE